MKKHIGFITLDFSLASRLSQMLRTAPAPLPLGSCWKGWRS